MSKIFNRFGRPSGLSLAGAMALGAMNTVALAQEWKVVVLDSTGADFAVAFGVWGDVQVGHMVFGGSSFITRATLWKGDSAPAIDLTPSGATASTARAVFGDQQVGVVWGPFGGHAALWNGSAESFVDLNPQGSGFGQAWGTCGTEQVGEMNGHAVMWSGSAASMIDLHPSGAPGSVAYAVGNGQQVGRTTNDHACMWRGSPESFVDLNPSSITSSGALGISGDHQVGWMGGPLIGTEHAIMWNGSPSSWVDLTPPGHQGRAFGGTDGFQVGRVDGRAALWSGTAGTYVDLSASLPEDMMHTNSAATCAWTDGVTLVIGGFADSYLDQSLHAVLWTKVLGQPCRTDFDGDGTLDFFDYDAFVVCFEGSCPQGRTADFDGDGTVDFNDYDAFVFAFEAGC